MVKQEKAVFYEKYIIFIYQFNNKINYLLKNTIISLRLKKMKVVILAGGYGTRLSEETVNIPKPMVEIGGKPILWHIMKFYSN